MTGMQEHPGTGRTMEHKKTGRIVFEEVARAMGVTNVLVIENTAEFDRALSDSLAKDELTLIILRKMCRLAEPKLKQYQAETESCHE